MRIVFIGATRLSSRCLTEILTMPESSVVGIVTNSEKFKISYNLNGVKNVLYEDLTSTAKLHGIPYYVMQDKMVEPDLLEALKSWRPDFILVIGWYHLVPRRIREMASFGCAGVHASLLPRYRGGAPLVWAMINGEKKTGVTLFHLDDGVDSGDIVGQGEFEIGEKDTIADLIDKAGDHAVKLLKIYLPMIADSSAPRIKQDDSQATHFPQRSPDDGRIDWSWSADRIERFIRAQTRPYPGAFTEIDGKRVRIWDAQIGDLK